MKRRLLLLREGDDGRGQWKETMDGDNGKRKIVSPPISRVLFLLALIRLFIWTDRCRSVHATYHCDGAERPMPVAKRPAFHSFGLAPGGVYHARIIADPAVRSYRTLSPLPCLNKLRRGGLLSVALSLGSPPPGVTRHLCPVVPGLSSPPHCWVGATVRRTDPHHMPYGLGLSQHALHLIIRSIDFRHLRMGKIQQLTGQAQTIQLIGVVFANQLAILRPGICKTGAVI